MELDLRCFSENGAHNKLGMRKSKRREGRDGGKGRESEGRREGDESSKAVLSIVNPTVHKVCFGSHITVCHV